MFFDPTKTQRPEPFLSLLKNLAQELVNEFLSKTQSIKCKN